MNKVHTSIRLNQLITERNLKQIDILKMCEPLCQQYHCRLGKNDLSQYVSGKTEPGQLKLFVLAKALNVQEAWLMGLDVPMERPVEPKSVLPPEFDEYNPKIHKIPILGTIAAGLPLYAEQHIEDYTYTDRNHGAEYFALKVKGDSMNAASINEGSLLIVRRQENVENGEIAVVMVNNENATVKRFKKDGNIIQLIPQSYNPKHQIQIYDTTQDKICIVGKVVECKMEF